MREYFRNLEKINLSLIIKKGKEKLDVEVTNFSLNIIRLYMKNIQE
jgi:hypothetical protein